MAISIKSNPDGNSGSIQVNGVDVMTISSSGIASGTTASLTGSETLTNKTLGTGTNFTTDALAKLQATALCF